MNAPQKDIPFVAKGLTIGLVEDDQTKLRKYTSL